MSALAEVCTLLFECFLHFLVQFIRSKHDNDIYTICPAEKADRTVLSGIAVVTMLIRAVPDMKIWRV